MTNALTTVCKSTGSQLRHQALGSRAVGKTSSSAACGNARAVSSFAKLFLAGAVTMSSVSCAWLTGDGGWLAPKDGTYVDAEQIPYIDQVDESPQQFKPEFVIPRVDARDEFGDSVALMDDEVPHPGIMGNTENAASAKMQKLRDKRWLYLGAPPSQVWPQVQNFLNENAVSTDYADPAEGLIETSWIKLKEDQLNQSKFLIRLEKGVHLNTTEVHVRHKQAPRDTANGRASGWNDVSDDIEREGWFLDQLAGSVAGKIKDNSASLLGQNVGGEEKVNFVKYEDQPALALAIPFKRAWASVAFATNTGELDLWEDESELGLFYFGYLKPGTPKKTMPVVGRKIRIPKVPKYTLLERLADLSPAAASGTVFSNIESVRATDAQQLSAESRISYLGYLRPADEGGNEMIFSVYDVRGMPLDAKTAKTILRLVRSNLI